MWNDLWEVGVRDAIARPYGSAPLVAEVILLDLNHGHLAKECAEVNSLRVHKRRKCGPKK